MPHQDGRDVVPNQPIPRRAGAPASGRHDQASSWTVKTSAASGHDGTAVRLGGEIHGGLNGSPSRRWPSSAPQTRSTAGRISFAPSSRISSISPSESRRKSSITWVSPSAWYAETGSTTAWRARAVRACRRATRIDSAMVSNGRRAASAIARRRSRLAASSAWDFDVACQPSPSVTTRRKAPGLSPPTQIGGCGFWTGLDRKSTRLNSSHLVISYAVFCLKKKKNKRQSKTDSETKQEANETDEERCGSV